MNIRNIKTYLYAVKPVKTCSVNLNSTMSKSILFFRFKVQNIFLLCAQKNSLCHSYLKRSPLNGINKFIQINPQLFIDVLFSLYLNDLENYVINVDCPEQDNVLEIGMHLLCLLYVDDTALLATNANELPPKK